MHLGLCENKGLTDPSLSLKDPQLLPPYPISLLPSETALAGSARVLPFSRQPVLWLGTIQVGK